MLAEAARAANIPFVMSGSATCTVEELAKVAPEQGWYQLYAARDDNISGDLINRAEVAGLSTLALTVDVPVHSNRERNFRNGFTRPLKLSWSTKLDTLNYPGWLAGYLTHGMPMLANWKQYAGEGASADDVANLKAATDGIDMAGAFLTAASPGTIALWLGDAHHDGEEAYV